MKIFIRGHKFFSLFSLAAISNLYRIQLARKKNHTEKLPVFHCCMHELKLLHDRIFGHPLHKNAMLFICVYILYIYHIYISHLSYYHINPCRMDLFALPLFWYYFFHSSHLSFDFSVIIIVVVVFCLREFLKFHKILYLFLFVYMKKQNICVLFFIFIFLWASLSLPSLPPKQYLYEFS